MRQEKVFELISKIGVHGDSKLDDKIRHTMSRINGMYLNINFKGTVSSQILNGVEDESQRLVRVEINEDTKNYEFRFHGRDGGTSPIQPYDLYEGLLKDLMAQYGRDVGMEFIVSYETGLMIAVPDRDKINEEERLQLFLQSIRYQCTTLQPVLMDLGKGDSTAISYLEGIYGIQFTRECQEYNIPLFAHLPEVSEYFELEKQKVIGKLEVLVNDKIASKDFADDYKLRELMVPYTTAFYKVPAGQDKQTFREIQWIFTPMQTVTQLGFRNILDLVRACLE